MANMSADSLQHETGHRTRQRTGSRRVRLGSPQLELEAWSAAAAAAPPAGTTKLESDHAHCKASSLQSAKDVSQVGPGAVTRNRRLSITMSLGSDAARSLPTPPATSRARLELDSDPLDKAANGTHLSPQPDMRPRGRNAHDATAPPSHNHHLGRHPRDCVPDDIGFPTPDVQHAIHQEDADDKLLMAVCAVLRQHDNRALCPKEIAAAMFERRWLHNAGSSPYTHISTCIRSHVRRSQIAVPPYPSLFKSYELIGALGEADYTAVGLRADEVPAVKRGTLWYLSEATLGTGVGAEDPFVRCRRETGRPECPLQTGPTHSMHGVDGDDEDGEDATMGRGKRKRRISSAAMAAYSTEFSMSPGSPMTPGISLGALAGSHSGQQTSAAWTSHRRSHSFGELSSGRVSMPRLKLRLNRLEEAQAVEDSDGFSSDAARYRASRRKMGRSSAPSTRASSAQPEEDDDGVDANGTDEDESETESDEEATRPSAFSSATSSALLAQSLLAASAPPPSRLHATSSSPHVVIAPGSLNLDATASQVPHLIQQLSTSAPSLFTSFPSVRPPTAVRLADHIRSPDSKTVSGEIEDADGFEEVVPLGEDFEFEWGADPLQQDTVEDEGDQGTKTALPGSREVSLAPMDSEGLFETVKDEDEDVDADALSTPATTPREIRDDTDVQSLACGQRTAGMELTLCQAMQTEDDVGSVRIKLEHDEHSQTQPCNVLPDSIIALGEHVTSSPRTDPVQTPRPHPSDTSTLAVPLPSPLVIELAPEQAFQAKGIAADYDFVGDDEDDEAPPHTPTQYEIESAEAADDEEDDADEIVTIKFDKDVFEDDESGFSSLAASRSSSVFGYTGRLVPPVIVGTPSTSGSDDEAFRRCPVSARSSVDLSSAASPPFAPDWTMHVDVNELEGGMPGSVDLLGPEKIGLEELDLAWADEDDSGEDGEWRKVAPAVDVAATNMHPFAGAAPLGKSVSNAPEPSENPKPRSRPASLRRSRRVSAVK